MHFDWRPGSYAVVVDQEAILLSLWDGPRSPVWTLPGGGIVFDEQPENACVREVFEETGFHVQLDELVTATTRMIPTEKRLHQEGRPLMQLRVLYRATVTSGQLRPEVGGSSIDAAWIPFTELRERRVADFVWDGLSSCGYDTETLGA